MGEIRSGSISEMLGGTVASYVRTEDQIVFTMADGREFRLYHEQDCCESVVIEDVAGELDDLVGMPILLAEEAESAERPADLPKPEYEDDSQTWTFYKLATNRGAVTIRWYGSSNGYYSESVDCAVTEP